MRIINTRKAGLKNILKIVARSPFVMLLVVIISVISAASYFLPFYSIYIILKVLFEDFPNMSMLAAIEIKSWGLVALLGAIISVVLSFVALILSHVAAFKISFDIKAELCLHLSTIPSGIRQNYGSGRIYKILDGDIGVIQSFMAHEIPHVIESLFYPLFFSVILFLVDWRYGIAIFIGLLLSFLFYNLSNSHESGGAHNMMDVYLEALENLSNETVEYVRGISIIKMFGNTEKSTGKLYNAIKEYTNTCIPYTLVWEKYHCVFTGIIKNLYLLIIPVSLIVFAKDGINSTSIATVLFYLILAPAISQIIPMFLGITNQIVRTEVAIEHLKKVSDIKDMNSGSIVIDNNNVDSEVKFDNVSFSYTNDPDIKALQNINFIAKPKTVTAFVGPSGSGKSTIAMLLARFWDCNEGNITISGIDIKDLSYESLMNTVSFVFQDGFVFNQTVLENIKCGTLNASDEDVICAAKAARCHEFILNLKDGYNTVLGEGGCKLSGGERQRICIARAILKNTPIVVFDEATTMTDPENEYEVQKALDELNKNKTVIMIAHRLSTVINADEIFYINNGKIIEHGTHEKLLLDSKEYSSMWNMYSENVNWSIGRGGVSV